MQPLPPAINLIMFLGAQPGQDDSRLEFASARGLRPWQGPTQGRVGGRRDPTWLTQLAWLRVLTARM